MKNSLIGIFLVTLLIPSLCEGQILIGLKGGFNWITPIGNSNNNPYHDATLKVDQNSFLISLFIKDRRQGKITHLGGELEYYQANLSGNQIIGGHGSGTSYHYNFVLNYLNVIFKPEFVFGSKWRFIINSGVYLSILIGGNSTGDWSTYGQIPEPTGIINDNVSTYFNPINLGLLVGFGVEYPLGKRIVLNLSSDGLVGLTKLAQSSLTEKFFNLFSLQISCGVAYKIDRIKKIGKNKPQKDLDDVYI